jgi:hypothetical protein
MVAKRAALPNFFCKRGLIMKGNILWGTGLLLVLGVTAVAYGFTFDSARSDCPGKIVCPITGEEVCKDQCPLIDASRSDCPGKIECPLTGKLVCRDECPLGAGKAKVAAETGLRSCCRGEK